MVKTKQTARGGSSSQQPEGMATAAFQDDPEEQFGDAPDEDIEEDIDLPKVLEDAEQPKEGKPSTSKSEGKTGEQLAQATEGAQAPPEEIPPVPDTTNP